MTSMPPEKPPSTDYGDRGYEVRILGVYGVTLAEYEEQFAQQQ